MQLFTDEFFRDFVCLIVEDDDIFTRIRVRDFHGFGSVQMIIGFFGSECEKVFLFCDSVKIRRFRVFVRSRDAVVNVDR